MGKDSAVTDTLSRLDAYDFVDVLTIYSEIIVAVQENDTKGSTFNLPKHKFSYRSFPFALPPLSSSYDDSTGIKRLFQVRFLIPFETARTHQLVKLFLDAMPGLVFTLMYRMGL